MQMLFKVDTIGTVVGIFCGFGNDMACKIHGFLCCLQKGLAFDKCSGKHTAEQVSRSVVVAGGFRFI